MTHTDAHLRTEIQRLREAMIAAEAHAKHGDAEGAARVLAAALAKSST